MKSNIKSILTAASMITGFGVTNIAVAETVIETVEVQTVDRAKQTIVKDMLKITFDEGSDSLSESSLVALSNFVKETSKEAKIDRYLVAAWSDKKYPVKGTLSKAQHNLASNRADHVMKALGASGASSIETFEMTKGPNRCYGVTHPINVMNLKFIHIISFQDLTVESK